MHFGKQLELDDVPKDASPQACEHERMNKIDFFKKYFVHVDKI
jgi:hypothetical protein